MQMGHGIALIKAIGLEIAQLDADDRKWQQQAVVSHQQCTMQKACRVFLSDDGCHRENAGRC